MLDIDDSNVSNSNNSNFENTDTKEVDGNIVKGIAMLSYHTKINAVREYQCNTINFDLSLFLFSLSLSLSLSLSVVIATFRSKGMVAKNNVGK